MIDEKRLIERLWEQHKGILANYECYSNAEEVADEICNVVSFVDELPKVGEWIPVSERLPKMEGLYLVSHGENYSVCIEEFNEIRHFSMIHNYSQPKAWMPLPEPYKGEEE